MKALDFENDESPLVLMELLYRLRVRDAMTTDVVCAARRDSLRRIQKLMKAHRVTGIPVAEQGHLFGIVSMGDIIEALDGGYIHESCGLHMTSSVVTLEAGMPLSFAVSYFGRYEFGRFPVVGKDGLLRGMLSTRDLNACLLAALSREINRMDDRSGDAPAPSSGYQLREFRVPRHDLEQAGHAANEIRSILHAQGVTSRTLRRIAVVAYELEINLCVHSDGGTLSFMRAGRRVEITARDTGPGIADVEWALRDGNSTADEWVRSRGFGAGMGLPNVRRAADEFDLRSQLGTGTTVRAVVLLDGPEGSGQ